MSEAIRQQECLNTLKSFNNTVVTIRLYPPNAPQIVNAIERGYKTLKQHLRQYGTFTFALRGAESELCGDILEPQVVQSISNLIVFRHLALLETSRLTVAPGLDRTVYKKLLEIFSAKVDQIKQEGGGWAFISRLGLQRFFPDPYAIEDIGQQDKAKAAEPDEEAPLLVRREFADLLLGRERQPQDAENLRELLRDAGAGAAVVAGTMLGILEGMVQKRLFVASAALEQVMESCGSMCEERQAPSLVNETARLLLRKAEPPALVLLLSQDLQSAMGARLCRAVEQQIPIEQFGEVIRELRQAADRLRVARNDESRQLQFVTEATERLLATPKGKQFLGQEKAKSLIEAGERARRARRVENNVKALLQGNDEVLQSDELNTHLPFVLQKMENEGMEREIRAILQRISDFYQEAESGSRAKVMKSLAQIGENLASGKRFDLLQLIFPRLMHWLENSENGDLIYEKVAFALHGMMADSWRRQEYAIGDEILSMFYQIRSGTIRRPGAVRAIIGRAQDKGLDRELMKQLLAQSLADPADETLSKRLILQGPIVTRFLVDSLIRAEQTRDRLKIIDLLTYGEQFLPAILVEKLIEPMPWFGKRNLIKLLGETGSSDDLEVVYPFLQHDDLRVQREAFICLYKASGSRRKEVLLRALNACGESMKLQVVRALIPYGDGEVAKALGQVLDEHRFYSDDFRDTLLTNVCMAIARCPYQQAERILQRFLDQRGERATRKIGDSVWQAAENALEQVYEAQQDDRQMKVRAGQLRKSLRAGGGVLREVEAEKRMITGLAEEKAIRELVEQGQKEQARVQLLELISKIARLRRFTQAEQLREWLIAFDAMALGDIIRAAEIIEEEKHAAVNKEHLEVWSGLFDVLTTEEFSTLYLGLQHKRYHDDELLVKKGAVMNSLFFINSGRVKLFFRDRDREVLANTLQSGQILGVGSFFNASVWTLSAGALGPVDASILSFETMQGWREEYPALESKLHDFCLKFASIEQLDSSPDKDRRSYQRYATPPLRLAITILDGTGQGGVTAKGELADISRGGGSFYMRISRRENARLLLGRGLRLALPLEETAGRPISFDGIVVAVRTQHTMENEYSVHVEFNTVLDKSYLQQLLQLL